MKKIFCLLLLIFKLYLYSQDIDTTLVTEFELGYDYGQMGFLKGLIGSGEHWCPFVMAIYEDEIYVLDPINSKIIKYSLEGHFLSEIPINQRTEYLHSYFMRIENGIIILYLQTDRGIGLFDLEGNFLFRVPFENSNERDNLQLYSINDYVIRSDNHGINGFYNLSGEKLDLTISEVLPNYPNEYNSDEFIQNIVNSAFSENLILGDNIFTNEFDVYREILNKSNFEFSDSSEYSSLKLRCIRLMGIDDDDNYYWEAWQRNNYNEDFVVITSKYGDIITAFKDPVGRAFFAPSKSGDIYFFEFSTENLLLWKIDRSW